MKKRNWIGISFVGGLVCSIAFGSYMAFAKKNHTFVLEDLQGDRTYLNGFPLEGYGGDDTESVDFTIINGNLETKYHSYGAEDLEVVKENRAYGENKLLSYLYYPIENQAVDGRTWIVPTKDAKLEHTQENSMGLFEEYNDFTQGETIKADAVEVFCEVSEFHTTSRGITSQYGTENIAQFPTGLILKDQPYIFAVGTGENGFYDYDNFRTNYTDGYVGEKYGVHEMKQYSTKVGDEIYTVVAPDGRCEGTTYVYHISVVDREPVTYSDDADFLYSVTRRNEIGTAEPIIQIPDAKVSRVVGLEGIGKDKLALFRTAGDFFIADIYDTEGNLVGSAKKKMVWDTKWYEEQNIAFTLEPVSEVGCNQTIFQEGISFYVDIRGDMEEAPAEGQQQGNKSTISGGSMLLWITDDDVKQMPCDEEATGTVSNGKQVISFYSATAKEGELLDKVKSFSTSDEERIVIIDGENEKILYEGCLKTDFWQDKLTGLAIIDNAKENGYLNKKEFVANGWKNMREIHSLHVRDWKE